MADHGQAPPLRPPLHRLRLPAPARAARLPARQRLSDLHRLRRRHRLPAQLRRGDLRHPPSQVVGSSGQVSYALIDGLPTLTKEAKIGSIDDKAGKPVNIHLHIGQRPILACGNSDGDQQMLEYTAAGAGPSLALLVHHDDAEREYAYDRDSKVGKLDTAWDEAIEKGWAVVSMKDDWNQIFPGR